MKKLKKSLYKYINSPLDPIANMELGLEYEKIGQGAAALSFFLRTAELVYETNPELSYCCIIKNWKQLNKTTRRPGEEISQLETAIAFLPKRPEAYFYLSTLYSKEKLWKKAYMYACLGLEFINTPPLPYDVEYPGDYMLFFQKAFAGWYVGQREESKLLWKQLSTMSNILPEHMKIIQNNLLYV
jgi:tetratricopeptide (TPR) repeat protein